MKYDFKSFYGQTEIFHLRPVKRETVQAQFPDSKPKFYDSFSYEMGVVNATGIDTALLPVTRKICYKVNGSRHKCDARCTSAKGNNCECSCGGVNHGSSR